jgi:peroxiredoxin
MKDGNIYWIFFFLIAFCLLSPVFSCSAGDTPSPYAVEKLVGRQAPDFTLKDMEGKPASLSSYRGRTVLLVFWASWCPTAKEEFAALNKLHSIYKDRGLVILAVSSDKSRTAAGKFISQNPVGFRTLYDERLKVSKSLYRAFMIPMAFLINRDGVILKKHFGQQGWTGPEMLKEMDGIMGKSL